MKRILITGTSGTGKSTVIDRLAALGHEAVDTDDDHWCEWRVAAGTGEADWVWRVDRTGKVLDTEDAGTLYLSGCKSNQGLFRNSFDHVVLLVAPLDVMLDRIQRRTSNPCGKSADDARASSATNARSCPSSGRAPMSRSTPQPRRPTTSSRCSSPSAAIQPDASGYTLGGR